MAPQRVRMTRPLSTVAVLARMSVYFILEQNDHDWRTKIGRTRDRVARRRALQIGTPRLLTLVGRPRDGGSTPAKTS